MVEKEKGAQSRKKSNVLEVKTRSEDIQVHINTWNITSLVK